jgi:ATP-dependent protease HslVU (ClpYQ) ATPase subunit
MKKKEVKIDAQDVEEKLNDIIEDQDLSRYIL